MDDLREEDVGLTDRLMAWLRGQQPRRKSDATAASPSSRGGSRELEEFVRTRKGVEAFLEPRTAIYSTTVLLIADDGEYLRRPVRDGRHAGEFCDRLNIPLYDAAKVGYPQRMREYDQGRPPPRVELSDLPPWPSDDTEPPDGPPPPPATPPR